MISLRKKVGTPLIDGLYITHQGHLYQIRLKDTQEVMSAVSNMNDLVRCGKLLIERYRTVEGLRRRIADRENKYIISEAELSRRCEEQNKWLGSKIYKDWHGALTGVETEVKKGVNKKLKKFIKIVDKG